MSRIAYVNGRYLPHGEAAVSIEEAQPAQGRRAAQPAHVGLVFLLPVGIEAPVTLQLGDLDPDRVQPISLDPPAKPTSR